MKVLVTGGAGFLGLAIVKRLRERGDEVVVFSRRASRSDDVTEIGATPFDGNLTDAEALRNATQGCDAVMHVAAKAGVWGKRADFFDTNLKGTRNVIAACHENEIPKLVYTSTPSVVFTATDIEGANEDLPYATRFLAAYPESKTLAEKEVLAANGTGGLLTMALRPHLIWGVGDPHLLPRVMDRARAGKLRQVGDGENRVDITHVEDAADAHVAALDALGENDDVAGRAYFLSSETVNLWDWIRELLTAADIASPTKVISRRAAYRIGAIFEKIYRVFGISSEPPMTRFVAENLATSHWFDISAAKRDLGYSPKRTGSNVIKEYLSSLTTEVSHG